MKRNIIKLFTVFLITFLTVLCGHCSEALNILTGISISGSENDYKMNLTFNHEFTDSAFIQKQSGGLYYIYLPDTSQNGKRIKIRYKLTKNTPKPFVDIDEKTYIKQDVSSDYIRISVAAGENASLAVISEKKSPVPVMSILGGIFAVLLFALIITGIIFHDRIFGFSSKNNNYHTIMPEGMENMFREGRARGKSAQVEKGVPRHVEIKPVKNNDFKCFDLKEKITPAAENIVAESTINKAKEFAMSDKQTNPLPENINNELSEFTMPCVDDEVEEKPQKVNSEIISSLNITPSKGFVLKAEGDLFNLYCFSENNAILLKQFEDLSQLNLQARFYDQNENCDIYIVRLDTYKAMIEFSESGIKELAVL